VFLDTNKLDVDLLHVAHITSKNVRSLTTSDLEILAALFRGRFLEGLELPRCPVFEAWRTFQVDALDRTRSLILQMLVERLRGQPERALPFAQALQSIDPTDEQVSLELRSLDTSARESAMRAASARLDRPSGGLPDAYFALNEHQRSQQIRYCRSADGVQIAYAISGKGPPILRAAHWMSHLQYEGKAQCGDTGSIHSRKAIRSFDTMSVATACPIGMPVICPLPPWCAIWRALPTQTV
jgi:hypothetical protein